MEHFSTARLTADRLREDHLADLVALHLHAGVSRYLGGVRPAERTKTHLGIRSEHPAQRTRSVRSLGVVEPETPSSFESLLGSWISTAGSS
jgi:hypothetical protein